MHVMSNEASQDKKWVVLLGRDKEGRIRSPSRILGVAWVLMLLGALITYAIWGIYDANGGYEDWYSEYENDDDGRNNNQNSNDGNQDQVANDDGGQNEVNENGGNAANNDGSQIDNGKATITPTTMPHRWMMEQIMPMMQLRQMMQQTAMMPSMQTMAMPTNTRTRMPHRWMME